MKMQNKTPESSISNYPGATWDTFSGEMINFHPDVLGRIRMVPLNCNAVLLHLFPESDDEGNIYYRRVITLACADKNMLEPLRAEASNIRKLDDR